MPVSLRALLAGAVLLAACGGSPEPVGLDPAPTGALAVQVAGLPIGARAAVTVAGPAGFSRTLDSTATLRGLAEGEYVVTAAEVQHGDEAFDCELTPQAVTVRADEPAQVAVVYGRKTGSLAVLVSGLPTGVAADVQVTGPDGFAQVIAASDTLPSLRPGTYTVVPRSVTSGGTTYAGSPATASVSVTRNALASHGVTYAAGTTPVPPPPSPATGGLALTIGGLPSGTAAAVTVTGPNGFSRAVTASTTLDGLEPGTYTVTAQDVVGGVRTYRPSPASQSVGVVASTTRATASVTYTVVTGELRVTVNGLPSGTNAAVTVTGPNAYSRAVTASTLLTGLAAGTYTVTAANVATGSGTYTASPASQGVSVSAGAEAAATVAYTAPVVPPPPPPPSGLNLRVEALYLVQTVQSLPDTVPLVANRDAYLRVFVTASASNTVAPPVRVRLYQGGSATPVAEYTLASGRGYTPTSVRQDTLALTWNQLIPAAYVQPGLRIQAEVDPANAVAESDEGDNVYPAAGSTRTLDVRAVNAFNVRFVPVTTSANGRTGNVSAANAASFLTTFRKLYPVQAVNADVRAPYVTTTTLALQSNNGNNAWGVVLSEIGALRTADGSSMYYYGVVPTDYSSGVAGMGYVPGRAAIGWDRLPSGDGIFAHELGHNLSLSHAPCGGVSGADPGYPYSGGTIGVYGFDVAALALKLPTLTDLMGYCSSNWISDYNYMRSFRYRANNPSAVVLGGRAQAGLLVWGRVVNGEVVLEPAFELVSRTVLPARPGPYAIEGHDAQGRALFAYSFDVTPVGDATADEGHFAFVIPMAGRAALARLQVRGGAAVARQAPDGAPDGGRAVRQGRGARVTWDARAYPMAMVRDAATGEILSFARGGAVSLPETSAELDVTFSDGVRSRSARLPAR